MSDPEPGEVWLVRQDEEKGTVISQYWEWDDGTGWWCYFGIEDVDRALPRFGDVVVTPLKRIYPHKDKEI